MEAVKSWAHEAPLWWLNGWTYEVVLYGAPHCGYGWYAVARTHEPMSGQSGGKVLGAPGLHGHVSRCYGEGGNSVHCASLKQALHEGVKALRLGGAPKGAPVSVVSPKGRRCKRTEV